MTTLELEGRNRDFQVLGIESRYDTDEDAVEAYVPSKYYWDVYGPYVRSTNSNIDWYELEEQ